MNALFQFLFKTGPGYVENRWIRLSQPVDVLQNMYNDYSDIDKSLGRGDSGYEAEMKSDRAMSMSITNRQWQHEAVTLMLAQLACGT